MIDKFTNEEKLLYASLIFHIFKKTFYDSMVRIFYITKDKETTEFFLKCSNLQINIGVSPEMAENTPLSKYIWENMEPSKKVYILSQIQSLIPHIGVGVSIIAANIIRQVLAEINVYPSSQDQNGLHFKDYGLI